ncbi:hypothetical protein FWK35_00016322 [Aphis craccivora]|nr:hypothetical protein FWK35_00016322 [Aphis craccivora]
MVEFHLS